MIVDKMKNLKQIKITHCALESIEWIRQGDFDQLKGISFQGCRLTSLRPVCCSYLPRLESVKLNWNCRFDLESLHMLNSEKVEYITLETERYCIGEYDESLIFKIESKKIKNVSLQLGRKQGIAKKRFRKQDNSLQVMRLLL